MAVQIAENVELYEEVCYTVYIVVIVTYERK